MRIFVANRSSPQITPANANLAAMALDAEFKKHLHSLMVEVYEKTIDETEQHKRELLFKARQTHNTAASPVAYKDAALYSMEFRLSRTIEKYIEAVDIWGFPIDAAFEKEMINEFIMLTAGPNQLRFPPMLKGPQVQAVQGSFARERAKLANRLVREGTNRLRELKMKKRQANNAVNVSFSSIQTNNSVMVADAPEKREDEIVMLKPNIYGIGFDIRALWRKATRGKSK